jgi:hypothetical protein
MDGKLHRRLAKARPRPATRSAKVLIARIASRPDGIRSLPFLEVTTYIGNNADLAALADALSEDVVTGLSRFSGNNPARYGIVINSIRREHGK